VWWNGISDLGPFAGAGPMIMEHLPDAQLFLSIICVSTLLLAAAIAERERSAIRARALQSELAHVGRLTMAGEMASGLAHELNQPLAAILTYAETCQLLADAEQLDRDALHKATDKIVTQSQRAGEIIRGMRNFTRKSTRRCVAVDINALVVEVAKFDGSEARKGRITIQFDLKTRLPPVWADSVQIQQVVLNLICNAIEAMEASPNGRRDLKIHTTLATPDKIKVAVSDTGPGLSADASIHLFRPFSTTKANGMGLGLSISKTIVEVHSGRLWVAPTNSAGGATFYFTLPVAATQIGSLQGA
jgi:two-component system sensor kinase FixL